MKADIKHEIEIMTTLMSFRHDPLRAVLYAFPWGRENTMFSGMKGPRDWQAEELFLFGEHIKHQEELHRGAQPLSVYKAAFSSGRGPGKTALASMLAWYCMSVRLGAPVPVGASRRAPADPPVREPGSRKGTPLASGTRRRCRADPRHHSRPAVE